MGSGHLESAAGEGTKVWSAPGTVPASGQLQFLQPQRSDEFKNLVPTVVLGEPCLESGACMVSVHSRALWDHGSRKTLEDIYFYPFSVNSNV